MRPEAGDRRLRHGCAAGGAGLVLVLAGCGGSGAGAPTDASLDAFCEAYTALAFELAGRSEDGPVSRERSLELTQAWAEGLESTGTPQDIPDEARQGVEDIIDGVAGLEVSQWRGWEDLDDLEGRFGGEYDLVAAIAVETYAAENCQGPEMLLPG